MQGLGQPGLRQRRDAAVCLANFESDGRGSSGLSARPQPRALFNHRVQQPDKLPLALRAHVGTALLATMAAACYQRH